MNGTLVGDIVLDTSEAATDTVQYVVTDPTGLTATSTRTIIIEAAVSPSPPPPTVASSTPEGLIDIDLVDKTLGSFVTISWDKYKALILEMREKTPDPFLGEYFQWLAELISRRMRENPRKPFYETHALAGKATERRHT